MLMRLLLLYLVLAAAWAWRLRPLPEPVMDAQRFPRLEKLSRYLAKAPPSVVQPILMSVAGVSDETLEQIDHWLSLPALQQLRQLTVQETAMLKNTGTLRDSLILAWLGQPDLAAPSLSFSMIAASGDRLDDQIKLYAYEVLAARAQKDGDFSGALPILLRAAELPKATWKILTNYTRAAQAQGQDLAALYAINQWINKRPESTKTPFLMEAREAQMLLMHRLKRADDAFILQLQYLEAAPKTGPLPNPDLERALVSGRAAAQEIKLLPWLARQLAVFPEHLMKPKDLLSQAAIDPDYIHWLSAYAAIADRELPAADAFEACLKLAASGERYAIPRLCALAESAKRVPEAQSFLKLALSHLALRSTILEAAQSSPIALPVVADALRAAPKDRTLHYAATSAEAVTSPGSAAALWQVYLRKFPSDMAAQRRLIQAHLQAHQPDLALRVYRACDPKDLNAADLRERDVLSQL
jgi:hypothetical protein